jgi:3-oxoacyl-[acyl-carrier protein] reductase
VSGGLFLVTGASRGIGAALALELAAPGRTIGINFRSSRDAAQDVARRVEAKGAKALLLQADATSARDVDALFAGLPPERLNALVCNAGIPLRHQRVAETSPEDFEAQWRSQALSSFLFVRRAAPLMAKNRSGRIVFVLSSALEGAPPSFMSAYVSAKYAALGLAKAVEAEYAAKGVTVHCVFPGMTRTDFIKDFPRPIVDAAAPSSPEEVAASIARLLEPR